jgi:hypothetical protein
MLNTNYIPEEISLIVSSNPQNGSLNLSEDGSSFEVELEDRGLYIPSNAKNCNLTVDASFVWWSMPNIVETGLEKNNLIYIFGDDDGNHGGPQLWTVEVPQGLYDLSGLNTSILSSLESQGAKTDDNGTLKPLINLTADENTQKVRIRFNYTNVYVDFTQANTLKEILGVENKQYGPYDGNANPQTAPLELLAPNVAAFNTINSLLLHSSLALKGIRVNNRFNNVIQQILINVTPGSQLITEPFRPPKINVQHLAGVYTKRFTIWLTDDRMRPVNTAGEYFGARLLISWLRPITHSLIK